MSVSRLLLSAAFALGLAAGTAPLAGAAETAGHGGAAATEALRLDNGKKWQTDGDLRRGMTVIRQVIEDALDQIDADMYSAQQYAALATRIDAQVDYITANCHLPEDADRQLHVVLEQVLDGVADLKGKAGQAQAAVKVAKAVNSYGAFFEHNGWRPLTH